MIRDISIAGTGPCRGCPRLDSILIGLSRLARLQPLTDDDCEETALLVCRRCLAEVSCVQEPAIGWTLNLAPAATVRL